MLDIDKIVENEIIAKIDTKIRVKTASAVVDGKQTLTFAIKSICVYLILFSLVTQKLKSFQTMGKRGYFNCNSNRKKFNLKHCYTILS